MKRVLWLISVLLITLWLLGCNSSSSGTPGTQIRVLHASPDAPNVNVRVGGEVVLEDVTYKVGSAYLNVPQSTLAISVDGILPGGITLPVIEADLPVAGGTLYTIVAYDQVSGIEPLVVTVPTETVGADSTRVQVLHAAPAAPEVDVYVVDPATGDPTGLAPLGTFGPTQTLGPVTVIAGDYRVLVTLEGSTNVVFDSGPVTLPPGADLLVAAVNNTAAGDAPISLVAMDGTGSFEILDVNSPASVRVVHASPDTGAVDVVANDVVTLVSGLEFPDVTGYLAVTGGDYNIKVGPEGNAVGSPVIDADVTLEAGQRYTVMAVGPLADIEPLILLDDPRSIATEARVRLVHGSPSAGPVDIYVTTVGADLADSTPAFTNVPFKAETGYVSLNAGSYDITVTATGSTTPAIGPVEVTLAAGGVYGAIARDAPGGGAPLDLILLDDPLVP